VGSVVGIMVVALILSLAALIYSGSSGENLATGSALLLLGGAVLNLVLAKWGSIAGSVVLPQDTTSAVVAVTLAVLLPGVAQADELGTVIAYTMVSTLVVGAAMLMLGTFRLGDLARFVPYPVFGGFLAGTGWLLIVGAANLASGGFDWSRSGVTGLVAAAALGIGLFVFMRRRPSVYLFPATIVAAVAIFYMILLLTGTYLTDARSGGYLPAMAGGPVNLPFDALGSVDWPAVWSGWVGFVTATLVATLALLLNVTSLELLGGADADLNRELRTMGAANLAAAFTGSTAGYHALGPSALGWRLGVRSRGVPLVVAAACVVAAAGGPTLIGLLPIPVIAGVLIMLGTSFIADWLIDARPQLSGPEYLLMLAIAVAVAILGFLVAVILGITAAGVLFAVTYSQIDPIRHMATGKERRSTLDRLPSHERTLVAHGDAMLVVELQGYLFFGTARTVVDRVVGRAKESRGLRLLLVDFRRVNGIDSTALASFVRLARAAETLACQLAFSGIPHHTAAALEHTRETSRTSWLSFVDLDHAMEWAEGVILEDTDKEEAPLADVFGRDLWRSILPHLHQRAYDAGATMIDYGESSVGLFVIGEGRAVAEIPTTEGEWIRVRSSGPGAVLGEMSLYLGPGRTARVRAEERTTVYALDGEALAELERSDPGSAIQVHRRLAELLAQRLSMSNDAVRALLR
jgi:SulP family sulfate permease